MNMNTCPPCKDCTERQIEPINCHTYCARYNKWLRERREYTKKLKQLKKQKYNTYGNDFHQV